MEILKNLKKHYRYYKHDSSTIVFCNGEYKLLYYIPDKTMYLSSANLFSERATEKYHELMVIFFENPFHYYEHSINRNAALNAYVYKKLPKLKEKGYVLFDVMHNEYCIIFTNNKNKIYFSIDFFSGEITTTELNY